MKLITKDFLNDYRDLGIVRGKGQQYRGNPSKLKKVAKRGANKARRQEYRKLIGVSPDW